MPMYEYHCQECGHRFEKFRWLSEAGEKIECPVCHSERVEREFSTFASTPSPSGGGCKPGPIG